MGYSGLIYAAIVAAWLAVLVPRWVRRNEEAERAREADAENGVRVLRRREGRLHASHQVATGPASDRTIVSGGAGGLVLSERQSVAASAGAKVDDNDDMDVAAPRGTSPLNAVDEAFARATQRRRRLLATLVLVTVAIVAGTYGGAVPAWGPAVSGAALVAFLVVARRAAVAQAERRARVRRRMMLAQRQVALPASEPVADGPARTDDGKRVAVLDIEPPAAPEEPAAENTWEPVEVPLPTYVTKPKAPRVERTIDLSRPGSWTSGRMEPAKSYDLPSHRPAAPAAAERRTNGTEEDVDADELPESRRAVGE